MQRTQWLYLFPTLNSWEKHDEWKTCLSQLNSWDKHAVNMILLRLNAANKNDPKRWMTLMMGDVKFLGQIVETFNGMSCARLKIERKTVLKKLLVPLE